MKVLYAALRHDPRDPDRASGVDYGFYSAIVAAGHDVRVVGPFPPQPGRPERVVKRLHDTLFRRRYLKWDWASIRRASRAVSDSAHAWPADVVFTLFPATIAFYDAPAPVVFNTDLTFKVWQAHGAGFSLPALYVLNWLEERAVHRSARLILFSQWSLREVERLHGLREGQAVVMPMPAALPEACVPDHVDVRRAKALDGPLRLLLVGKEFHRKGVDIAHAIVAGLNEAGIPATLTVCATAGPPAPHTQYVGRFRKSDPAQLDAYIALYRDAHLLLHPARFEPAGIVPGEAAAFATPTLTNDSGGLATTVADGQSGLVLPKNSPAAAYIAAIRDLIAQPDAYYALCQRTHARYKRELNWTAAGQTVDATLHAAAALPQADR